MNAAQRVLERARATVEAFYASNYEQRQLQALLLTMLDYMQQTFCRPGQEADLARWWGIALEYRRVLVSPELAGEGRRKVLAELLD